jgi:Pycsar effector protein
LVTAQANGSEPGLNLSDIIERAEKVLKRLDEWSGRFDTRSSIVTAVCLGMLGVLASTAPVVSKWTTPLWIGCGLSTAFLFAALLYYFYSQFPRMPSPNPSLIFFHTISQLTCDEYRTKFLAASDTEYLEDLLCQAHTVAILLRKKFAALQKALLFLLLSVLPWGATIYLSKLV